MLLLFGFFWEVISNLVIERGVRATGYMSLKLVGFRRPGESASLATGLIILVLAAILVILLV